MRIKIFAKDKPGLNDVINFIKQFTTDIEIYIGNINDPFPQEAKLNDCDLIISYLSPWIIPKEVLQLAKLYSINFHPGPPEYPGIGCTNFALYEGAKSYGVTCHLMEEKVDSGKIISVKNFPIFKEDTVLSLTNRCYDYIKIQFYEVVGKILNNEKLSFSEINWKRKPFTRKQLNELSKITFDMTEEEIKRRVRATYYPGMPYPYIKIGNFIFSYSEGK